MTDPEERNDEIERYTKELIRLSGGSPDSFESDLVSQLIHNSLKMLSESHDIVQLKLISRAMKEMRYAYRIFEQYGGSRSISMFGSARRQATSMSHRYA